MSLLGWDSTTFCLSNIDEASPRLLQLAFLSDSVEAKMVGL